ncbi:hypothetical protein [Frateuria defendens]|uniref:hypothetical protein n=1 Tax=Frateuria defendens TaxID=2219559 RepID=UPI001293CE69|nr:hypothetical protein [Frateuria defendens]
MAYTRKGYFSIEAISGGRPIKLFFWIATVISFVASIFILVTTIYGAYHNYSPVQWWDQWVGGVGFYQRIREGDWAVFWEPHNEHRIVFSRILFLFDIGFFGGVNVFLIVCNLILLGSIGCILIYAYKGDMKLWIGAIVFGFVFSWIQYQNIVWGFESQCIAIYVFSLLAFLYFSKSEDRARNISLALLFCTAATLAMGNGIASFFVAAIQGMVQRRPLRESVIMGVAGGLALALYLIHFHAPELPVAPDMAAVHFAQAKYLAIFLGGPIFHVGHGSLFLAATAGIIYLLVAGALVAWLYLKRQVNPFRSFLIGGIGIVVASALAAAHGRWMLGFVGAASYRYETTPLLGYALLFMLALDVFRSDRSRGWIVAIATFVLAALTTTQTGSWATNPDLYERELAVLGLKIGIDHPEYDAKIFPEDRHDTLVQLSDIADRYQIGMYGKGWLHDAGMVQFDPTKLDPGICEGRVDTVTKDASGYVVSGWVAPRKYSDKNVLIVVAGVDGKTVGYGVTGRERVDVYKIIPSAGRESGWTAFSRSGDGIRVYAFLGQRFCELAH